MPVGTGTLIKIAGRKFLVTAAHLFDDFELSLFAAPNKRHRGIPTPLEGAIIRAPEPKRDSIDIAVIDLSERSADALSDWDTITLNDVKPPTWEGPFALCGYPSEKLRPQDDTLNCTLITAFTDRIQPPSNASGSVEPGLDLFFRYDDVGINTAGESVSPPHLKGTSGCTIWQMVATKSKIWTPNQAMKVVGVQSSAMRGEWFRAKSWVAVLGALSACGDDVEAEIAAWQAAPPNH